MEKTDVIISRFVLGDTDSFRVLVDKYQQSIFNYVYKMIRNKQDAEDITQEVFIIAMRNVHKLKDSSAFKCWLYKIAHNSTLKFIKKSNLLSIIRFKNPTDLDRLQNVNPYELSKEFNTKLESAINKLKTVEKTLLYLRVLEEMNYEELGEILEVKPATLRKRYERIRTKLRQYYINGEEEGEYEY